MKTNIKLKPVLALIAVLAMLVVTPLGGHSVRADNSTGDGRLNQQTWAYAGEAIAVYCLDTSNNVASNFDGGLKILNQDSNEILKVTKAQIDTARAVAVKSGAPVKIADTNDRVFSLYVLDATQFQINSGPTRIGLWTECTPTSDPSATPLPPTLTPSPTPTGCAFDSVFVTVSVCCPVSNFISPESDGQFTSLTLQDSRAPSDLFGCCFCCARTSNFSAPDSSGQSAKFAPPGFGINPAVDRGSGMTRAC